MRIQFDIDDDLWNRVYRYAPSVKMRHYIAQQALIEWVTRREGRDKKLQAEQIRSNRVLLRPIIQEMIDSGDLNINDPGVT